MVDKFDILDSFTKQLLDGRTVTLPVPTFVEFVMAARELLWIAEGDHDLGMEPGAFQTALFHAAMHADRRNLARLAIAFPTVAAVVDRYKNSESGLDELHALARLAPTEQPPGGSTPKGN